MLGAIVGSYQIVSQIGEGGMGVVYLGRHSILGRPAAIKVLHPELSQRREIVGRFFNEARAATASRHPGIVEIYDFGFLPDGAAFIAMEFLEGESLASRLRRERRIPAIAAIQIGRQIAAALHAAHTKGITHRDLKPDNVFLVPDPEIGERVKLLDFGIAKLTADDTVSSYTREGMVMGTPAYMSPEQCRGASTLDSRSDLYSLGCMLYELLAGRPPFQAESASDVCAHHMYFQPEPVRAHDPLVPEALDHLIMALLNKDPAQRPATAGDVAAILDQWRTWNIPSQGISQAVSVVTVPAAPSGRNIATTPTTLSGAATSITGSPTGAAPPRSKRGIWFATTAVLAAVVGVAIIVTTRPGPAAQSSASVSAGAAAAPTGTAGAAPAPQAATPPPAPQVGEPTAPRSAEPTAPQPGEPTAPQPGEPTTPPRGPDGAEPGQRAAAAAAPAAAPAGAPAASDEVRPASDAAPPPKKSAPGGKRAKPSSPAKHAVGGSQAIAGAGDHAEQLAPPAAPGVAPIETTPAPPVATLPGPPPSVPVPAAPAGPGSLDAVSSIASVSVDGPLPDSEIRSTSGEQDSRAPDHAVVRGR